jgi:ribosomal protein S18 acetylase RimI-like enzyme
LPRVADLIELCFDTNMDSEGRSYVRQMRRASRDVSFMRWASAAIETASLPLSGFVWEQDGRIIGNASLVPFRHKGKRIFLIANVATHPDHRRKGIARFLTEQVMRQARQRGAEELWLHVRADNPARSKCIQNWDL